MALIVEYLDTLRLHKKRRRYAENTPSALDTLPAEWRVLLIQWLRLSGNSRWETLLKKAGIPQKPTAETLLDWLLNHGWVMVDEVRQHGDWWPYKIEWQHADRLRKALGLPIAEEQQSALQQLLQGLEQQMTGDEPLQSLLASVATLPVSTALKRGQLLQSLLDWQAEQRCGSYRDFALFARGDTKAVSAAEWAWLDSHLELINYGIHAHTPLLYLSANLQLQLAGAVLDITAAQPFIALPVTSLATLTSIHCATPLRTWIAVENLTSFERLAAQREQDTAVVWLPGFAPSWWQQCMSQLIRLCPAPLQVACDPDPSGVHIARQAMQLWHSHQLAAQPWRMGVAELQHCQHRKPLDRHDQQRLQGLLDMLTDLHPSLAALVQYMHDTQEKGEQEAYL